MHQAWSDKLAAVRAVAFSPDGLAIASGADDGTIKLWNVKEGKEQRVFETQSLPVTSLAFSPDGGLLASSTGDWRNFQLPGELKLWDVASAKELASLSGHTSEIKCLAIDPSGKFLTSAGSNRVVRLWQLSDRETTGQIRLDSAGSSLAFSPDGSRLAVGENRGGVTLWDVPACSLNTRYAGHPKAVSGLSFSPDGKRLATAGHDGVISLWPVPSGDDSSEK
jgi:WD40 repeat protein